MSQEDDVKRAKGSGWKSVYDTLRAEILTLELKPGQLLDEQTLAERFDMSRSPVREALIRLAGEELVVTLREVFGVANANRDRLTLTADPRANCIVVRGTPALIEDIRKLMIELDNADAAPRRVPGKE